MAEKGNRYIHLSEEPRGAEDEGWMELGMRRLEEDWDNPQDAVYDKWKDDRGERARRLLGVGRRFSPDRDSVTELVTDRAAEE